MGAKCAKPANGAYHGPIVGAYGVYLSKSGI